VVGHAALVIIQQHMPLVNLPASRNTKASSSLDLLYMHFS
jgi:hypothetical protein